ncbi:MAG: RNA methyltransferase [Desulfobacterales bacterium]|nr:RNA methyltransferase [Desulfobacterales bacterium]MDJ0883170.1 RNA methyltransferase [Desulfobacterales bacterium]
MTSERVNRANVRIVLHQPRFPENIGAAARAMRNMGLHRLVVVNPENFIEERIRMMATHVAGDVVDAITRFDNLPEALADCQFVVGTTARLGGERQAVVTPPVMARRLISISRENEVALVFGPEDRGLTNQEIRLCHALVNIPTDAFASLNLAQAVMVMCYEVFTASTAEDGAFAPRLATRHELDGMYAKLRDILVRISYINPENPDYWMNRLRRFFTRLQLRAREVSIIRGIIRQVEWYARKNYEEGLQEGRRRASAGKEE